MIKPLFGARDDEWVVMVGRYVLNMGAAEWATRLLIERIDGTESEVLDTDLVSRVGFIRKRYPRENRERHERAMRAFEVAKRHSGFRNIVAHSPLAISAQPDGSYLIQGIFNATPQVVVADAELVSLAELRGRVDESAALARQLLEMQDDFPVIASG
jgi:hypothetical protein